MKLNRKTLRLSSAAVSASAPIILKLCVSFPPFQHPVYVPVGALLTIIRFILYFLPFVPHPPGLSGQVEKRSVLVYVLAVYDELLSLDFRLSTRGTLPSTDMITSHGDVPSPERPLAGGQPSSVAGQPVARLNHPCKSVWTRIMGFCAHLGCVRIPECFR